MFGDNDFVWETTIFCQMSSSQIVQCCYLHLTCTKFRSTIDSLNQKGSCGNETSIPIINRTLKFDTSFPYEFLYSAISS